MTESRRTQIHCHCFVDPTLPNGMVSLPAAACCLMLLMLLLNVRHPRVEDASSVWHQRSCNNVQNHQSRL